MPRAPTIFDVAARAGVSKSTVSNVIRGTEGVADETRQRVQDAIRILGYRPNALARQFVRQRTTILGVLVGDLENPFHAEMAKNVERHAFERGYTAMLCNIEGALDFGVSRVEALLEQHVAGLVFLTFFGGDEQIRAALGATPAVFAGLRKSWGDSVSVNDRAGARLATEHLVELGHRRIAFLTSSQVEARETRARHTGYRAVLRAAGLPEGPSISWEPDGETVRVARREMPLERLLTGRDRHTAVFCTNDLQAIALLDFADRHGLRVPEDVSVVGFDDVHLAGLARISLTSVRQPKEALAEVAVEAVLARLAGTLHGPGRHQVLAPSIAVRGSTAPPGGDDARTRGA